MKENKLMAVIRVRGRVRTRKDINETLRRLNLGHVNNLVLINPTPSVAGMIKKCNSYITYGEIDKKVLQEVLDKKLGKVSESDASGLFECKKKAEEVGIKMPIKMKPPKHGYEWTKLMYKQGGALGDRGEEINAIIKRML
jgi:large subunit ribosomal protein L30